jgi:phosphatidate cytidylyltransferase
MPMPFITQETAASERFKMLKRFNTSVILVLLLLPLIWLNTLVFTIVVGGFLLIATYELFIMFKEKTRLNRIELVGYGLLNGVLYTGFYLFLTGVISALFFINWILVLIAIVLSATVFLHHPFTLFANAVGLSIYFSFAFAAIAFIQGLGTTVLLYVLLVTMLSDVFAYLVGVRFGKHKLAPKISPKKSIEGLMGGIVGAVSIAMIYVTVIQVPFPFEPALSFQTLLIISILVSLAGQLGDLVASKIKRDYGIKDFSQLFPGHGGVLDRFDSTLFASFVLVIVFIMIG